MGKNHFKYRRPVHPALHANGTEPQGNLPPDHATPNLSPQLLALLGQLGKGGGELVAMVAICSMFLFGVFMAGRASTPPHCEHSPGGVTVNPSISVKNEQIDSQRHHQSNSQGVNQGKVPMPPHMK